MKQFFLSLALLCSLPLLAQDCSPAALQQKPGTWKAGAGGSTPNITAANLIAQKAALNNIHIMIKARYNPKGCEIMYAGTFGRHTEPGIIWWGDPYYYSMYILPFLCDKPGKKSASYVAVSTPTTVNVSANMMPWANSLYAASIASDDNRGYLKLKTLPQLKNGAWFMGEEVTGDYGLPSVIKEYRWLITYDDALPFTYLSRKEYLLIQQKRLRQITQEEGSNDFYQTCMAKIVAALRQPDTELNQPAVCPWNDEQRFTGFVAQGTAGSFTAIKPNPAYYHRQLPKSSPQFITVVYKVSYGV